MQFLICPASEEQLEFGEPHTYFQSPNGNCFNYLVEMSDHMIVIKDTCDRYMPVDMEEIAGFAMIFNKINDYLVNKRELSSTTSESV